MYMVKQDIRDLHQKLDEIRDFNSKEHKEISMILSKLEEHQRSINGTIAKHEKENKIRDVAIQNNRGSIIFAKGTTYALTALGIIFGLVGTTKAFGIW
jgi:hypothetical protein